MSRRTDKGHDPEDMSVILTRALDLIGQQTTLTLATSMTGAPWAAPVYYAFHRGGFYFFSSPDSRHIKDALASGQTAAAVHQPSTDWREIRGLQMSGVVRPASTALRALGVYLKKYPFTRDFFKPGDALDLATFARRMHVSFYRFRPGRSVYMDNGVRFGFREEILL